MLTGTGNRQETNRRNSLLPPASLYSASALPLATRMEGFQASSCVGPGKSNLQFELRGRAGDCPRPDSFLFCLFPLHKFFCSLESFFLFPMLCCSYLFNKAHLKSFICTETAPSGQLPAVSACAQPLLGAPLRSLVPLDYPVCRTLTPFPGGRAWASVDRVTGGLNNPLVLQTVRAEVCLDSVAPMGLHGDQWGCSYLQVLWTPLGFMACFLLCLFESNYF